MSEQESKSPAVRDPVLLEKMRECWKKWRAWRIAIHEEGKRPCPVCKSVPIEKERKCCAVCEHKRSGRGVTQGNPTSSEKR